MSTPPIYTRADWQAKAGTGTLDPGPESRVVIHHSFRPSLAPDATVEEEIRAIQGIERFHTDLKPKGRGWDGIGYNWLIAPSGRVYEGRGWKYRGAHAGPVNGDSIGYCLLIDGSVDEPTPAMMAAARRLTGIGLDLGEIAAEYTVSGHRDHMDRTCPGDLVYARLHEFRHDYGVADRVPVVEAPAFRGETDLYIEPGKAGDLESVRRRPVAELARDMDTETFLGSLGRRLGPVARRLFGVLTNRILDRLEREADQALGEVVARVSWPR